jgi:hypothetical protein
VGLGAVLPRAVRENGVHGRARGEGCHFSLDRLLP